MERETLKQWMSDARLEAREDEDGYLVVTRRNLEISVSYLAEANLVVCFSSLLELAGLEETQRLEVLEQALALNCVGTLPVGCAVSYDASDDVIYLLWQQSPDSLDSTQFQDAFENFETAAEVVQDHLRGEISETTGVSGKGAAQNMVLKV